MVLAVESRSGLFRLKIGSGHRREYEVVFFFFVIRFFNYYLSALVHNSGHLLVLLKIL